MLLKDRVAIITGGAQGLGKVYALAFAKEGAKVVIADINAEGAAQTAREIQDSSGEARSMKVDITNANETAKMAEYAVKEFGGIDVLVNNAALYYGITYQKFDEIPEDEWDRMMRINVKGVWLCVKAVSPQMKKQGKGKIINVSSGTTLKGNPGLLHYVASKGAIIGMTRSLARELGEYGINVNCIAPGFTLTEASYLLAGGEAKASVIASRALKRHEMPEDVIGVVIFLSSNLSDFLTGQTIAVNGGDSFL